MSKKINISHYVFTPQDRLLFDTNIWFYLIGPSDNPDKHAQAYFNALHQIQQNNSTIFIDVIILSEFINRYAKYLAQQKFNIDKSQYDKFRESSHFKEVALQVAETSKKILKMTQRISSGFEALEMDNVLSLFAENKSDFNDQVLENICIANDLKLVTNDADFKRAKCVVLTANHKLW